MPLADFMTFIFVFTCIFCTISIYFFCSVCNAVFEIGLYILIHVYRGVQLNCLRASELMELQQVFDFDCCSAAHAAKPTLVFIFTDSHLSSLIHNGALSAPTLTVFVICLTSLCFDFYTVGFECSL